MARGCRPRPLCEKRAPPGRLGSGLRGPTLDKEAKGSIWAGVEDTEEDKDEDVAVVGKVGVGTEADADVGFDTIFSSPKSSNEGVAAALSFVDAWGEADTGKAGTDAREPLVLLLTAVPSISNRSTPPSVKMEGGCCCCPPCLAVLDAVVFAGPPPPPDPFTPQGARPTPVEDDVPMPPNSA